MSEFHLTEDQQDCLQELINIAMGQASDQLARYLDTFVYLKVPSIESIDAKDLLQTLSQQNNTMAVLIAISSILTTTFLNVFARQIDNQMSYNAPKLLPSVQNCLSEHLQEMTFNWDLALKININYQVTDYSFNCNMILLIPETAIINIKKVLDRILAEF